MYIYVCIYGRGPTPGVYICGWGLTPACMYVYICIYGWGPTPGVCIYVAGGPPRHACVYICLYIYMYVRPTPAIYVYTPRGVYTYIAGGRTPGIYICIYVHMYMHMCIYIYGRGPHPGCICIYMAGGPHPGAHINILPGAHPGIPVCIYICTCGRGLPPGVFIYICTIPRVNYMCCGRRFSQRVYTQCHGASFTLAWVGVFIHATA